VHMTTPTRVSAVFANGIPLWLVTSRGFGLDAPVVCCSLTLFSLSAGIGGVMAAVIAAVALVNGGLPLMIVAGQDLPPHAVGSATGLLMGFAWGTAGVLYVAIGLLQGLIGIQAAMLVSSSR